MEEKLIVRKATNEDRETFFKLVSEFYYDAKEMLPWWKKNFETYIAGIMLAELNDQIAGYIAFFPDNEPGAYYIGDLYIKPEFRRKGIAIELVKKVEEKSKKECKLLRLDVRKKDEPAIKLYTKLGFQITGEKNKNSLKLAKDWR